MKDERKKILELLSKGVLKADEAEHILDAMDRKALEKDEKNNKSFKMIRILVISSNKEQVNIAIPLEFAKMLKQFKTGIDMEKHHIDIDKIIDMARSGAYGELVNIQTEDGDQVKITID